MDKQGRDESTAEEAKVSRGGLSRVLTDGVESA